MKFKWSVVTLDCTHTHTRPNHEKRWRIKRYKLSCSSIYAHSAIFAASVVKCCWHYDKLPNKYICAGSISISKSVISFPLPLKELKRQNLLGNSSIQAKLVDCRDSDRQLATQNLKNQIIGSRFKQSTVLAIIGSGQEVGKERNGSLESQEKLFFEVGNKKTFSACWFGHLSHCVVCSVSKLIRTILDNCSFRDIAVLCL